MFLFWNQCCDLTCTWVLRIVRQVSATTIRELWKGKVYHSHVHVGWQSGVLDEREREFGSVQFTQSSLSLCDLVDSTPGFPVHHQLPEPTQTHVHWVGDAIQLSHPLSSRSLDFSLSQHQGLFKWVSSSHQVAKGLEFQLQHQSFQWIFRTDFL